MKKKTKIILLILAIIMTVILVVKFISFGNKEYKMPNSNIVLKVPSLSSFKEECCMYSATFRSFSSVYTIKRQLDSIMNGYEKYECSNKKYYYDKKSNITISDYGVKIGFPLNEFYITYDKGKRDDCNKVENTNDLNYKIYDVNETGYCYIPEQFNYIDIDGESHNVHYQCFGNLAFENGVGKMIYIDQLISYKWLSMDDIINFLELQVKNNDATREIYKDGGSILYKNKDFSLLKCNTIDGNKDIYIGDNSLKYEENYCK